MQILRSPRIEVKLNNKNKKFILHNAIINKIKVFCSVSDAVKSSST